MKHDHISFIYYNMDQLILPLDLEILIPEHHLARVVHKEVDSHRYRRLIDKVSVVN